MATWTERPYRALSTIAVCVMSMHCGSTEQPPTVTYGSSPSTRIFNEPDRPATSAAPVVTTPIAPATPGATSDPGAAPPPPGATPVGTTPLTPTTTAGSAAPPPSSVSPTLGGTGGTAVPPSGGAGGMDGAAGSGDTMPAEPVGARPTMLLLSFTTKTQQGRYAPDNVGAAWVESSAGKWIHTLNFWANVPNGGHLARYTRAGGPDYGSFFGIPVTKAPADVVTQATLHSHQAHTGLMWNLKDGSGNPIADGSYKLVIELTEAEAAGEFLEIPFDIGPGAVAPATPDSAYYTGIQLTLQ